LSLIILFQVQFNGLCDEKFLLRTLKGHTYYVLSVAFSPDGKYIASGSMDNTIRLCGIEIEESISCFNLIFYLYYESKRIKEFIDFFIKEKYIKNEYIYRWFIEKLKEKGYYEEVKEFMMNIFENKWDLYLHKIWIETCVSLNQKNDIINYFYENIDIIREEKEILDFYYNKAVEFEEKGDYKTASLILEKFVNQDIKYKDVFSRYQKLLVKLEIGNTSDQKIEIKEKGSNQVFDPNLTRVVSDERINKKYEFIREIEEGGMGIVYEAKDRKLNRKVAIKKIKEELSINPREKKRFI
jgi:tetratricopeptide (TPR) repeat protein